MEINILTIGENTPKWVDEACKEYIKRFPKNYRLNLQELPLANRHKSTNIEEIKEKESAKVFDLIKPGSFTVALDKHGKIWSTEELAKKFNSWQLEWSKINFVVGGPNGFTENYLKKANEVWSLGNLTLPHQLVKVVILEQIYRAYTILIRHPYHK
jgi:23S rRNA (pseudouridine1915-N3)-methyltransferase